MRNDLRTFSHPDFRTMTNELPPYFDSQAAASAALGVSIYDLRDAKTRGCPAFRSGRVYRKELLAWLKAHPISKPIASNDSEEPEVVTVLQEWDSRREMLFALGGFLDSAFADGEISAKEYRAIGGKTVGLIIELGRVWKAGIDEAGYLLRWAELSKKAKA